MDFLRAILFVFLLAGSSLSLFGVEGEPAQQIAFEYPDPGALHPGWWGRFVGDRTMKPEEQKAFFDWLNSLPKEMDEPRERAAIQRMVDEITLHFESLLLLRHYSLPQTIHTWLPQESYTLQEYLSLHDQKQNLLFTIELEENEWEQQQIFAREYRQALNNEFIDYTRMASPSKKKFMDGLELIAKRTRLAYLEENAALTRESIRRHQADLRVLQEEIDFATQHLLLINVSADVLQEKEKQLKEEVEERTQELLHLEAESIRGLGKEAENREKTQLLNQRIIYSLAQDSLLQTQMIVIQMEKHLEEIITLKKTGRGRVPIDRWTSFYQTMKNQLNAWKETTAAEIDLAGKGLISLLSVQDIGEEDMQKKDIYQQRINTAFMTMVVLDDLSRQLFHIDLIMGLSNRLLLEQETRLEKTFFRAQEMIRGFLDWFSHWFYFPWFEVGEIPITLAALFKAFFIIVVAFLISRFVRRFILRAGRRGKRFAEATMYTLSRVVHYLILLLGLLFALVTLGLQGRNIAIVLGALGVGAGFGLQNIVNNFLSGLTILFGKNIEVGDFVELDTGQFGRITEVKVQSMTIHTNEGTDVILPNSYALQNKIINWTKRDPYQRMHIPFGVAYGTDQERVREIVCGVAEKIPYTVLNVSTVPKPEVWLMEFGESSLNFELVVWINIQQSRGRRAMRAIYLSGIEKALKEACIVIPFPQRVLHLRSVSEDARIPLSVDLHSRS